MAVIDAHTHMPGQAFASLERFEVERFLSLMDANGVDKAWVFTVDGLFFDHVPYNDQLREFCSSAPDRLIPFCTVNPRDPQAVPEFRRCILELGMQGVKLHPWAQAFSPVDAYMDALGEEMAALRVPVVFHDGTPPYSSPLQIAYFAARHPSVPVILGHGGLHDLWLEAVYAAERYPNIYLTPAGMPLHGLRQALDRLPVERFLFASDAGFGDAYWQPFQMHKLQVMGLSNEARKAILGGNAERVMAGLTLGSGR